MSEDRYTRITVPLSKAEFEALRASAQAEYRHPRDQARYLLRQILLDDEMRDDEAEVEGEAFHDLE